MGHFIVTPNKGCENRNICKALFKQFPLSQIVPHPDMGMLSVL